MRHIHTDRHEHEATEDRSEVEYIFAQFEEPGRSALPGEEVQQWRDAEDARPLRVTAAPNTPLRDADTAVEDLEPDWKLALTLELIADTFADLLRERSLAYAIEAAQRWQARLLHDPTLALHHVQTACEHLQGVIDAASAAQTGRPTRWWPGKLGSLGDPRRQEPGRWYQAMSDLSSNRFAIRKVSALSVEVLHLTHGTVEVMTPQQARRRFKLTA